MEDKIKKCCTEIMGVLDKHDLSALDSINVAAQVSAFITQSMISEKIMKDITKVIGESLDEVKQMHKDVTSAN